MNIECGISSAYTSKVSSPTGKVAQIKIENKINNNPEDKSDKSERLTEPDLESEYIKQIDFLRIFKNQTINAIKHLSKLIVNRI